MPLVAFFIAVHTSIVLFQCHVAQCLASWGHDPLPPPPKSTLAQFQGEPRQRGRKSHGVGKFCDFRLKSPFISETVRDRSVVTMER